MTETTGDPPDTGQPTQGTRSRDGDAPASVHHDEGDSTDVYPGAKADAAADAVGAEGRQDGSARELSDAERQRNKVNAGMIGQQRLPGTQQAALTPVADGQADPRQGRDVAAIDSPRMNQRQVLPGAPAATQAKMPSGTEGLKPGPTWGDRVRGHRPQSTSIPTEDEARKSHMLTGVWNPVQIRLLLGTMLTDWSTLSTIHWTDDEQRMRELALSPAHASCDASVRPWTDDENATMVAYMEERLDLPHPPNFIKEILIADHRALLEDYHEEHFNATLTANLPPTVRIARHAPHADLFKEIFHANTDKRFGTELMRTFQADVKRLTFDGLHTLHVVFYSRHAASKWTKKALRFQKAVIVLQDTARAVGEAGTGSFNPAQLEMQYAVRVYGADALGLVALSRAFQQFSGAEVLDVEYARATKTEIYDNRYHTVRFAQVTCPPELVDVTQTNMDGICVYIHHFQTHLRRPCGRCLNPHHGLRKCKNSDGKVSAVRNRYARVFNGGVSKVNAVPRSELAVNSISQLLEALNMHKAEGSNQAHQGLQRLAESVDASRPLEPGATVGTQDTEQQPVEPTTSTPVCAATDPQVENTGYTVHRSKGAKAAFKKEQKQTKRQKPAKRKNEVGHRKQLPPPGVEDGEAEIGQAPARADKGIERPLNNTAAANKTGKRTAARYAAFQRDEATGYYGALAELDGSDDDAEMEVDADALSGAASEAEGVGANDSTGNLTLQTVEGVANWGDVSASQLDTAATAIVVRPQRELTRKQAVIGDTDTKLAEQAERRCEDDMAKTASAIKHRRRQLHAANRAGFEELGSIKEDKHGLVQTSMSSYMSLESCIRRPAHGDDDSGEDGGPIHGARGLQEQRDDDVIPATPDSQEDFTMGRGHIGGDTGDNDLPIQLGQWLESFNGHEIEVAANGHCAFLALYAAVNNHPPGLLKCAPGVVKMATDMKATVYACMMANLRHDVELGLIDPITECARIFPTQPRQKSAAAATAGLFAHYAHARGRKVDQYQPVEFWAGTHELRAMAQYLREPLLVLDVVASGDAHIQQYLFKDYRLADGTDHESGYVTAMTDRDAADYLRTCWELHVLPTFLVLRRHERHFYGVGHGELYARWHAEGDAAYAAELPASYEWIEKINTLTAEEAGQNMDTLNTLNSTEFVNAVLRKRMPNRDRLDVVHARRGLPTLDRNTLVTDVDELLKSEETLIHAAYGVDIYAVDSNDEDGHAEDTLAPPVRCSRISTGPAMVSAYSRILSVRDLIHVQQADQPLLELMRATNREAFSRWCTLNRTRLNIPTTRKRKSRIEELYGWLIVNHLAARHLFAFLPYPELEAKSWPVEHLVTWGVAEVFAEQTQFLVRIMQDASQPQAAREYCQQWYEACTVPDLNRTTAYMLAQAPERWARLEQWTPVAGGRAAPAELQDQEWCILHVLPYTVAGWTATPMARTPRGARAVWHAEFSLVQVLCSRIVEGSDWGTATEIVPDSSGMTKAPTDDTSSADARRH